MVTDGSGMGIVFRGIPAPASLKLGALAEADHQLGLVFRGIPAPASLKLFDRQRVSPFLECFPGYSCPGLIEASPGASTAAQPIGVFRGIPAPASLKLGFGPDEAPKPATFSGVFLPRPH